MSRKLFAFAAALVITSTMVGSAHAACVNKYVARSEGNNKKILTLLTGKLTFDEAKELGRKLGTKSSPPVEWVDEGGNVVASSVQFQAVRPMPVACDDKPSGSVINVTFLTFTTPAGGITIKFSEDLIVYFDEQNN